MSETWIALVLDASVIFNLRDLKCLVLPFKIAEKVYIAQRLFRIELEKSVKNELSKCGCIVAPVTSAALDTFIKLGKRKKLSEYDRETISLAKELDVICATDDRSMRIACEELEIKITGTLGILGRSFDLKIVDHTSLKNCMKPI